MSEEPIRTDPEKSASEPVSKNEAAEQKKSAFITRLITALILIGMLAVLLWAGGWVFSLTVLVCVGLALYEELRVLTDAGHYPVWWISIAGLIIAVPVILFLSPLLLLPFFCMLTVCALFCVMRRKQPDLLDLLVTLMPLLSIVLPGGAIFGLLSLNNHALENYLVIMMLSIAIGGDTFAYLVGSALGGAKLCPAISPKKTIAGALGGLLGSVLMALLVSLIYRSTLPADISFPGIHIPMIVGLLGGIAGQMGDLFASMIKRYCNVKDFSNIFPGHGGMMDRMDSILFVAVIVYSYRILFF